MLIGRRYLVSSAFYIRGKCVRLRTGVHHDSRTFCQPDVRYAERGSPVNIVLQTLDPA